MTEKQIKPIFFEAKMVQAILDGRKKEIRRVIHPQPNVSGEKEPYSYFPDYLPGDILYVREKWSGLYYVDPDGYTHFDRPLYYFSMVKGAPDIRGLYLKVTDLAVKRLQDIDFFGCINEGIPYRQFETKIIEDFSLAWDDATKKTDLDQYGWAANPWVWVISFEKISREAIKL